MSNKKIVYSKEDEGSRAKKVKERKTSRHEEEKEKNLLGVRGKKIKSLRIKWYLYFPYTLFYYLNNWSEMIAIFFKSLYPSTFIIYYMIEDIYFAEEL